MIFTDCMNYDGDTDCMKCTKRGYMYECPDECSDYENFFGYDVNGNKKRDE